MYTKDELNRLLEKIVKNIDISYELFDIAEKEYLALGKWIDKQTPTYKMTIYAQGSFALGTVIKPTTDNDEYDLDLVCEFEQKYGLSAQQIKKDVVGPLLFNYQRTKVLEEKRRCWHVEYERVPNFHMDIIPAINRGRYIDITDYDEDFEVYEYIGSNPKGYIAWFNSKKALQRNRQFERYLAENRSIITSQADVEAIKEYRIKTPLQKAIQLLKRHRDIMFKDDDLGLKPVSIIITTIAAQLYNNEDNIVDTLDRILSGAKNYILSHKIGAEFHVDNPSYTGDSIENFADKWNENPEKAEAFWGWLENAQTVFLLKDGSSSEVDIATLMGMSLGDNVVRKAFEGNDAILAELTKKDIDVSTALVPYKVRNILEAPHRQRPPWKLPRGVRIIISAKATTPSGKTIHLKNDGTVLEKGTSLDFRAVFGGISHPFVVKWQIVNIGSEAASKNGLRGNFELSDKDKFTKHEGTEYSGSHSIQCFVLKNGECKAKSDVFIVNIA